ncbi:MAG: sulfurtransferase TusA family protein [Acidobacteriota bacterium]
MATVHADLKGLRCPLPTLRISVMAIKLKTGDVLDIVADCPSFETDVRDWCVRAKKVLVWLRDEGGGVKRCQIKF